MSNDIAREVEKLSEELGVDRKRPIGEVAKELKVEAHVIRFWEEHFPQIKPEIGLGKRRYYYNKQLRVLKKIKKFLYEDGYTIAGLQKLLSKRKHDAHAEEDLDVILEQSIKEEKLAAEKNGKIKIEFDDFIHPEIEVKVGQEFAGKAIDPAARLKDFSGIKIPEINPKIKKEILELIPQIKKNLQRLKNL
jgi:DNA-binding transcriptional MerR regulator